ncbi:MAG: urease accessory protein UreF [Chitinophagales bacterium]
MSNSLFHLLHLSDPNLPIGGFSHSSGLETYVQNGMVKDEKSARIFIQQMLQQSLFYNDAMYLSLAYQACETNDFKSLENLDIHCNATKLAKETRVASQKLGLRLLKIFEKICTGSLFQQYKNALASSSVFGHFCIAFAIISHDLKISLKDSLTGFYYNAASGYVTNCVKLVPLGQQTGQSILFDLIPIIDGLVKASLQPDIQKLGLCSVGFDIRSMQHENLYSRLYMS